MTSNYKRYWTLDIFYRGWVLSNFFVTLHGADDKISLIRSTQFIDESNKLYELSVLPMGLKLRMNYHSYKNSPREIQIEILSYLAIENFEYKVNTYKNDSNLNIDESLLKIFMK